jgi:hypothetical protein
MKTLLSIVALLFAWTASAQDFTYSTNLFYALPYTTNIFCGTNGTDPARDSYLVIWNKINHNTALLASQIRSSNAIVFTNTVTLAPGATAYCVNYGGVAGLFQLGLPAGASGTNSVTAMVFSNTVLSSAQYVVTNVNPLNFSGSNYIGRISQFYDFALTTPLLGGGDFATPTNEVEAVWLSYTGTNAWFLATRFASIFTNVSVAVVGTAGNAGSLVIYGIDHPELVGRTNSYFGQFNAFPDPANPTDAVNKRSLEAAVANTLSPFLTSMDASNTFHVTLLRNAQTLIDIGSAGLWIHIDGLALDGTGTNVLLSVAQSGLLSGWNLQASTNLVLLNGWTTFTNYTMATNSGEVTFTIPFNAASPVQFFRAGLPAKNSVSINAPVNIGGALQLYTQTNTPTIGDLGNQRGGRLWLSNGFFFVTGSTNGTSTYTKPFGP